MEAPGTFSRSELPIESSLEISLNVNNAWLQGLEINHKKSRSSQISKCKSVNLIHPKNHEITFLANLKKLNKNQKQIETEIVDQGRYQSLSCLAFSTVDLLK